MNRCDPHRKKAKQNRRPGVGQVGLHLMQFTPFAGSMTVIVFTLAAVVSFCNVVHARPMESKTQDGEQADDERKKQNARQLQEMRRLASEVKFFKSTKQQLKPIPLIKDPVFRFNDNTRESSDATLWVLGRGRPAALLAVENYGKFWGHELVSLSTEPQSATTSDGWRWQPMKPGIAFHRFSDDLAASKKKSIRLRQMKTLAGRFKLSEQVRPGGERYVLRMLPRPVYRYNDLDTGIVEGALFLFVFGTNPEAVCIVECRRQKSQATEWFFAFAPLSAAELTASMKDKVVWRFEMTKSLRTQTPYTLFQIPSAKSRNR